MPSAHSTRAAISVGATLRMRRPKARFCATVMFGNSARLRNAMPVPRCAASGCVTLRPSTRAMPVEGCTSPATMRSVVVLPQPEGPSRAGNPRGRISSETPSASFMVAGLPSVS
jgi:hypothetical protein